MTMNDPVADMLTRIRNGQRAKLVKVKALFSGLNVAILKVLKEEGYILDFKVYEIRKNINELEIYLKYLRGSVSAIKQIDRVSKPGLRQSISVDRMRLKKFYNGLGIKILSTSKGVMPDKDAIAMNIGGEVLCQVF